MRFPYFEVSGPDGESFCVEMKADRLTIGRYQQFNDIALEPDPQQLVTRKAHCTVERDSQGVGSLIRVPLGIHRRSGQRYPFVDAQLRPVAPSLQGMLAWLGTVERAVVPPLQPLIPPHPDPEPRPFFASPAGSQRSIRAWNAQHDPLTFIGRFVRLNHQGVGCCPFGWHHRGGHDTRASFKVYQPGVLGGYCWYCYTWQRGGSVFDFLRYWYNLDAKELWRRIQAGEIEGV